MTGGSDSRAEGGVDFGNDLTADQTLSYRLTGRLRDADAEYDHSRDDETFLTGGSDMASRYGHDGQPRDRQSGSRRGAGKRRPSPRDRFRPQPFFGEADYDYRDTDRMIVTAQIDHDFGGSLTFGSTLRKSDSDTDFGHAYISAAPLPGGTITPHSCSGDDSSAYILIGDARSQYDTQFGGVVSRTLVGIEYADSDSTKKTYSGPAPLIDYDNSVFAGRPDSVPLITNNRSEVRSRVIYLQQDLTFDDRFVASMGLRHDWLDTTQTNRPENTVARGDISQNTVSVGLTYRITPGMSAYGSCSESVLPASLTVEPGQGDQV